MNVRAFHALDLATLGPLWRRYPRHTALLRDADNRELRLNASPDVPSVPVATLSGPDNKSFETTNLPHNTSRQADYKRKLAPQLAIRQCKMLRLIVIGIISTFLLIPIAGYSSNIIKNEIALIAVSVVTGYMIVPAILLQIWKSKDFDIGFETMEKALIRGKLQTTEFSVSEVIEIEEFEDEGDHYLFSVGDNKTLSLFGQYLYEYKERNDFPSTIIRVFSNKESKVVYGIECAGEPIQVSKVLESPVPEAWKAGIVPIDNDLVNKSLSDILREIDNYA